MLNRVSYHSVIRYLERVLGLPVDEWLVGMDHLGDNHRAMHCCERAGLPVDAVRLSMLTDPVIRAIKSGRKIKTKVVTAEAIFVVDDGVVVTVLAPEMQKYRTKKYKAHKSRQLVEV